MEVRMSAQLVKARAAFLSRHAETSTHDGRPMTMHALYIALGRFRQEGVPPTAAVNVQAHRVWADWQEPVTDGE